jgi:hypothetical protein
MRAQQLALAGASQTLSGVHQSSGAGADALGSIASSWVDSASGGVMCTDCIGGPGEAAEDEQFDFVEEV